MNTVVDTSIARNVARQLLKIKAVSINTKRPYRYVSGMLAPIYTDNRLLMSHPEEWKVIIDAFAHIIRRLKRKPDVLSATAMAAIPHAAALSYTLGIPMVYVRTSKKSHGKENTIEGKLAAGSNVLVLEDLISTGKSIALNVNAIRQAGGNVTQCLAITTSTISAFVRTVTSLSIELLTLTDIQTIVKTAMRDQVISGKEARTVYDFLTDPMAWKSNS